MSQEAVPDQEAAPAQAEAHDASVPAQQPPKGLLQQMEELMAALNADLTQLDADLQQSTAPSGSVTSSDPGACDPDTSGPTASGTPAPVSHPRGDDSHSGF
ncbi:hypothetical protein [Streptomyces venezuelae]|uniref:Uncharacterized protein n=1 Tax=Streptomyces venezuelae TaxID=54571 RepID=A0A5P2BHS2_STRVZ|nr:hypothetical protein [Streptomyces venezuelae]QES30003.1 hypothetical protein DEJ47_29340 [Streptomyces venezuelae]